MVRAYPLVGLSGEAWEAIQALATLAREPPR